MKSHLDNGWCLMKTNKVKPTGYKGYTFTLYGKDDVTIIDEIKARALLGIGKKAKKLPKDLQGLLKGG